MSAIIPEALWQTTRKEVLLAQPGTKVQLSLSGKGYDRAFSWAKEQFGEDVRLATWTSDGNLNATFIFAEDHQAIIFKLRWAGK